MLDYIASNPQDLNPNLPKTSWDFDWDKRDPASLIPPQPTNNTVQTEDEIKKQQQKLSAQVRPTATRHLFLIRHGQYNLDGKVDEDRYLTKLGWEQAEFVAKRLKSLSLPYTKIVQSSMTRAKNTASVIAKQLPDVPVSTCDLLREGAPIRPVPESPHWRPEAQVSMLSSLLYSYTSISNNGNYP